MHWLTWGIFIVAISYGCGLIVGIYTIKKADKRAGKYISSPAHVNIEEDK